MRAMEAWQRWLAQRQRRRTDGSGSDPFSVDGGMKRYSPVAGTPFSVSASKNSADIPTFTSSIFSDIL